MNSDIRVATSFYNSLKRRRLQQELGADGVLGLLDLWLFAALHRPSGDLTGLSVEEIALAANYAQNPNSFLSSMVNIGFIDERLETDGSTHRALHDWQVHNAWVANSEQRSEAARALVRRRWDRKAERTKSGTVEGNRERNTNSNTNRNTNRNTVSNTIGNTPSPYPLPSPSPSPYPKSNPPSRSSSPSSLEALSEEAKKKNANMPLRGKERPQFDECQIQIVGFCEKLKDLRADFDPFHLHRLAKKAGIPEQVELQALTQLFRNLGTTPDCWGYIRKIFQTEGYDLNTDQLQEGKYL